MIDPRKRKFAKRPIRFLSLFIVALAALTFWLVGLALFLGQMPKSAIGNIAKADAVVVLTGGSGRLEEGLELLSRGLGEKLFISGVYHGVDVRQLLQLSKASPAHLDCCIALGYEADNTRGNAVETAEWMEKEGYGSLILVTAAYHMPRSLLEFGDLMPDLRVEAYPVFPASFRQRDWWRWPGSARLVISEYHKYLIAFIRTAL